MITSWTVIGSGLAGYSAATQLIAAGCKVKVARHGSGATSVSSGAWSLGHTTPGKSFEEFWSSLSNKKTLDSILVDGLRHLSTETVIHECTRVASALSPALDIRFNWQNPFLLPDTQGRWRSCYGAQAVQTGASSSNLRGKRVVLIGSARWRFRYQEVARNLSAQIPDVTIVPVEIAFPVASNDWPIPRLFIMLDKDVRARTVFMQEINNICRQTSAEFILMPPLLSEDSRRDLQSSVPIPFAECLATTEPCAGFRLQTAIETSLLKMGASLSSFSRINGVHSNDGKIVAILGNQGNDNLRIDSDGIVLATGRLFGGGIELGYDRVCESICSLPVFMDRVNPAIARRCQIDWAPRNFRDSQPWARLGLSLDQNWRPVDDQGLPVFSNVRACGSLIGGIDWAHSGIGLGFGAYSGGLCVRDTQAPG